MQHHPIRIGTRESQLAVWQANWVKTLLEKNHISAELIFIKSDGDIDLTTPLYAMGVQGVFTRSLDIALVENKIDIAVHSMKDVPVQLPEGIAQAAVLKRGNYKDVVVGSSNWQVENENASVENLLTTHYSPLTIATSSIRRKAQWLHRYPNTTIENLRGNVNTRLKKLVESNWHGAIFAAAGLERIGLRPSNCFELDWMLPAPAQGAIMVVCRENDAVVLKECSLLNDADTFICTKMERDFLSALMGGCSTPISALAEIIDDKIVFKGNIVSPDGKNKVEIEKVFEKDDREAGLIAARELMKNGGNEIVEILGSK